MLKLLAIMTNHKFYLPKNLISNVNNIQEAYLEDAADFRQPLHGKIGDVQASTAYARTFIFDDLSVQCHFVCLT